MIVKNTTDNTASIQIKGKNYTVPANDTLPGVPEEHAKEWQRIHAFLQLEKEADMPRDFPELAEKTVEKEETEEVKEDAPEEKKEDSKKVTAPKAKK